MARTRSTSVKLLVPLRARGCLSARKRTAPHSAGLKLHAGEDKRGV